MKKRTVKLLSLMMVTTFLATSTITTEAAGTGAYQLSLIHILLILTRKPMFVNLFRPFSQKAGIFLC